jgi:hypothetical protein
MKRRGGVSTELPPSVGHTSTARHKHKGHEHEGRAQEGNGEGPLPAGWDLLAEVLARARTSRGLFRADSTNRNPPPNGGS